MSAVAPLLRRVYSKAFSLMLVSLSGFSMNRSIHWLISTVSCTISPMPHLANSVGVALRWISGP